MSSVSRPVCHYPSGVRRPSERFDMTDSEAERCISPAKLSRPQKRRRRLQKLAVHKACDKMIKQSSASAPSDAEAHSSIHEKLDRMESMLHWLLGVSSTDSAPWHWNRWEEPSDAWNENETAANANLDTLLLTLNSDATSFGPSGVLPTKAEAPATSAADNETPSEVQGAEASLSEKHAAKLVLGSTLEVKVPEFVPKCHQRAATLIQRRYRKHQQQKSHPSAPSIGEPDESDTDYHNTYCKLCAHNFSTDPSSADSCDICAQPFHTFCLTEIPYPLEALHVCGDCIEVAKERALGAYNRVPAEGGKPQDMMGSMDVALDSVAESSDGEHNGRTGEIPSWPDLNADQQTTFKKWYSERRRRQREVLEAALEHEITRAEQAKSVQMTSLMEDRLSRAKHLRSQLQLLEDVDLEHMRKECWRFLGEAASA